MNTPASTSWIPGLILVMASMLVSVAQPAPDPRAQPSVPFEPANSPASAATAQIDASFATITTVKDSPQLPLPDRGEVVAKRQPPKLRLSPWTSEVVKLAESGLETAVILAFIENSGTFNLGADQIVYLNDLGLSGEVINAMLQHDRDLISGIKPLTIASDPEWAFSPSTFTTENPVLKKPATVFAPSRSATTKRPGATMSLEPGSEKQCLGMEPLSTNTSAASPEQFVATPKGTFDCQERPAERMKSSYPVREPYPVEITSPIVIINADGRLPNTLVVLGFPRSSP